METEDHSAPLASMAGAFEMVGACGVADVPAVVSVRRSDERFRGLELDTGLCGEEVHAVVKYVVETHLIMILVKLLQDSSAQRFVGWRFQRGEENECVELFFSELFELEPLQGRFDSID